MNGASCMGQPNGTRKLRLRPPNLQSREPDQRSRQLGAMLGPAQVTSPAPCEHRPWRRTVARQPATRAL